MSVQEPKNVQDGQKQGDDIKVVEPANGQMSEIDAKKNLDLVLIEVQKNLNLVVSGQVDFGMMINTLMNSYIVILLNYLSVEETVKMMRENMESMVNYILDKREEIEERKKMFHLQQNVGQDSQNN